MANFSKGGGKSIPRDTLRYINRVADELARTTNQDIERVEAAMPSTETTMVAPPVASTFVYDRRDNTPDSNGEYSLRVGATEAAMGAAWNTITSISLFDTDENGMDIQSTVTSLVANGNAIRVFSSDTNWGFYRITGITTTGDTSTLTVTHLSSQGTVTSGTTSDSTVFIGFDAASGSLGDTSFGVNVVLSPNEIRQSSNGTFADTTITASATITRGDVSQSVSLGTIAYDASAGTFTPSRASANDVDLTVDGVRYQYDFTTGQAVTFTLTTLNGTTIATDDNTVALVDLPDYADVIFEGTWNDGGDSTPESGEIYFSESATSIFSRADTGDEWSALRQIRISDGDGTTDFSTSFALISDGDSLIRLTNGDNAATFVIQTIVETTRSTGDYYTITVSGTPVASRGEFTRDVGYDVEFIVGTTTLDLTYDSVGEDGDAGIHGARILVDSLDANAISTTSIITRTLSSNNYEPRSPALGAGPAVSGYSLEANDGVGYFEELRGDLTGSVTAPSPLGAPAGFVRYLSTLETREYLNVPAGTTFTMLSSPDGMLETAYIRSPNPLFTFDLMSAVPTITTAGASFFPEGGFDTVISGSGTTGLPNTINNTDRYDVFFEFNNFDESIIPSSSNGFSFGVGVIGFALDSMGNVISDIIPANSTISTTGFIPFPPDIPGGWSRLSGFSNFGESANEEGVVYSGDVTTSGNLAYRASDLTTAEFDSIASFVCYVAIYFSDSVFGGIPPSLPFDVRAGVLRDSEVNMNISISSGTAQNITITQGAA